MQIQINGTAHITGIDAVGTLRSIFPVLEQHMPDNQVLTDIQLNGKPLPANWYDEADNIYLLDEDTLTVTTLDAKTAAAETLKVARSTQELLNKSLKEIATKFRLGQEGDANKDFIVAIENLQLLIKVFEEAAVLLDINLTQAAFSDDSVAEVFLQFDTKLGEIITTQQANDWVLLADQIDYELIPLLNNLEAFYQILGE